MTAFNEEGLKVRATLCPRCLADTITKYGDFKELLREHYNDAELREGLLAPGGLLEGIETRSVTVTLVICLLLDLPFPVPTLAHFGVDTNMHRYALNEVITNMRRDKTAFPTRQAVFQETKKRIREIYEAFCDGPALTKLVRKYATAPEYEGVRFEPTIIKFPTPPWMKRKAKKK